MGIEGTDEAIGVGAAYAVKVAGFHWDAATFEYAAVIIAAYFATIAEMFPQSDGASTWQYCWATAPSCEMIADTLFIP